MERFALIRDTAKPWWFPRRAALYALVLSVLIPLLIGLILSFHPFEPASFDIVVTPPSLTIKPGTSALVNISVEAKNGYDRQVALVNSTLPPNVDIFFDPQVGVPSFTSNASIFVRPN